MFVLSPFCFYVPPSKDLTPDVSVRTFSLATRQPLLLRGYEPPLYSLCTCGSMDVKIARSTGRKDVLAIAWGLKHLIACYRRKNSGRHSADLDGSHPTLSRLLKIMRNDKAQSFIFTHNSAVCLSFDLCLRLATEICQGLVVNPIKLAIIRLLLNPRMNIFLLPRHHLKGLSIG